MSAAGEMLLVNEPGFTIAAALAAAAARLAGAGLDEPRREARLLLAAALAAEVTAIVGYPERRLGAAEAARFAALVARRAAREPAARILGKREFWSLDFALSPETLVPRPDSETLIEAVVAALPQRNAPLRILDFGTGTGCLLLALLSEYPAASGLGVDIMPGAVATARANAGALGLGRRAVFLVGSWGAAVCGAFDVIVANPPYIAGAAIAALAPEVARHEPRRALDGGADGLDAYRALMPEARRLLHPGGIAAFELGAGQQAAVAAIVEAAGLVIAAIRYDLAGIARCLVLRRDAGGMTESAGAATKKHLEYGMFPSRVVHRKEP